jgi:hypothetical protein
MTLIDGFCVDSEVTEPRTKVLVFVLVEGAPLEGWSTIDAEVQGMTQGTRGEKFGNE